MSQLWTIQQVAKSAGITSRTLRHYDQIGLFKPTTIADNGYRLYDAAALIRLQRILALRDLGLSLPQIRSVLDRDVSEIDALADLEQQLEREKSRLARQIASVQRTLSALREGESPMSENMFDGFRHEEYREEVVETWGQDAWSRSNDWWNEQSDDEKSAFMQLVADLNRDWQQACADGVTPESEVAQVLARRHVNWLGSIPGTPAGDGKATATYVRNPGEMYVSDSRFAANYGGVEGATFVRDALTIYTQKHL